MGNCLKCGSAVKDKAAFCDQCLQVMEQYPIKPGSVAHLQPRPQRPERKSPELYRETVDKQQLLHAKRSIRWLIALTLILSALLLTTTGILLQTLESKPEAPAIGKNYTTTQQP